MVRKYLLNVICVKLIQVEEESQKNTNFYTHDRVHHSKWLVYIIKNAFEIFGRVLAENIGKILVMI